MTRPHDLELQLVELESEVRAREDEILRLSQEVAELKEATERAAAGGLVYSYDTIIQFLLDTPGNDAIQYQAKTAVSAIATLRRTIETQRKLVRESED